MTSNKKQHNRTRNARQQRRGAVVVELAVLLPFLLVLAVGAIEIGRAIEIRQTLAEASRAGCRLYTAKEELTKADAETIIATIMSNAGITDYSVTFDPPPWQALEHKDPVSVTIEVNYDDIALMTGGMFMSGATLESTCIMPADKGEYSQVATGGGGNNGGGNKDDDNVDDGSDDQDDKDDKKDDKKKDKKKKKKKKKNNKKKKN